MMCFPFCLTHPKPILIFRGKLPHPWQRVSPKLFSTIKSLALAKPIPTSRPWSRQVEEFKNSRILISGGAGFVGSNLVKRLLTLDVEIVHVVDNLLSAEQINLPKDACVRFTEGSIADDKVLDGVHDHYDYIFHLSTYHGNQSSMANPLIDHENNLLTTLKFL